MSKQNKKFWPMTSQQSFVASSIFLSILVVVLLFIAIGEKLLNWISVNAGLAAWLQAVGALAIVYATYELHNSTKKSLDRDLDERKKIEKIRTKFFINQNRNLFGNIQLFLSAADFAKTMKNMPVVRYPAVEYFRVVQKNIYAINKSTNELSKMFSKNSIPDSCLEYLYEIHLHLRQLKDTFLTMTAFINISDKLQSIGSAYEIENDPEELLKAEFLENHLKHQLNSFEETVEVISINFNNMMKNVYFTNNQ